MPSQHSWEQLAFSLSLLSNEDDDDGGGGGGGCGQQRGSTA